MRSYRSTLLILAGISLLAISFLSCSDPVSFKPEPAQYIMPLAIGNQWFGTRIRTVIPNEHDTISTTLTVTGDTVISDTVWATMYLEEVGNNASPGRQQYGRNDSFGLWHAGGEWRRLMAKYPASVQDSVLSGMDANHPWMYVRSIDRVIDVLAGRFVCYEYEYIVQLESDFYFLVRYFYSPGVGMVKSELWYSSSLAHPSWRQTDGWELDSLFVAASE